MTIFSNSDGSLADVKTKTHKIEEVQGHSLLQVVTLGNSNRRSPVHLDPARYQRRLRCMRIVYVVCQKLNSNRKSPVRRILAIAETYDFRNE